MLNPDMIVHWMQLTAGSGVLQPWFLDGVYDALERRMQPALDLGVTRFMLWCRWGWRVQAPPEVTDPAFVGKIPFLMFRDGRSESDARLREIEDEAQAFDARMKRDGITLHNYGGSPRLDWRIASWLAGSGQRGTWSEIEKNVRAYRGMPLTLDAMSSAGPEWWLYCRILAERLGAVLSLEGQAIPPAEFGHLFMHRDWRPDVTPLVMIAAAPNPWKGCLIRSDADLNGADRVTRVRELIDAGVHVVIDSGSVL